MSLTVKAFLVKGGNEKAEIRRFTVPQDVSASFDYLQKKIADIFPGLARGNFNLFWKGTIEIYSVLIVMTMFSLRKSYLAFNKFYFMFL